MFTARTNSSIVTVRLALQSQGQLIVIDGVVLGDGVGAVGVRDPVAIAVGVSVGNGGGVSV